MSIFTRWFDDISIQRKLLISFAIPVLLMLLVSISVHDNTQSMVNDSHWVVHTHKAIARAQELLNLVIDMETGQRGYLITGDRKFLEPYELASENWHAKLALLSEQVSDNPRQVERLALIDNLHHQWLETAGQKEINQRTLVVEGKASMQTVIDLIGDETGKKLIDNIRLEFDRFISMEEDLILVRTVKSDASANQTSLVLLVGTLIAAFISTLVALLSSNRLKYRLKLLLDASNQVSLGKLDKGVSLLDSDQDLSGKDEVSKLTDSFRVMAKNLAKNNQRMQDSNDKLKQERQRAQAAAKAKSDFLSTMSHEIRTPMNGVLGISQLIEKETKELSTKQNIKIILDSGQHLMTILNDILDFSKVEENKLELDETHFCLAQVIEPVYATIQNLADEKGIQLIIQDDTPEDIVFFGDSARVRQILFNLAGNAVKFTHEGHVLIRASLTKDPERLMLTVSDTGIGISKENQEHIFNPFEQADSSTTRKFGGTGLGLAIVNKLVDLIKGDITLKSEKGNGTQFIVTLPLLWKIHDKSEPASSVSDESNAHNEPQYILRILLVEDNHVNVIVAKKFCEQLGHTVEVASNGLVATQILQNHEYDLILMDNHMPEMNGTEATRFIRSNLGINTLLFAYTADVFLEAHDNFIEAGADHVLTKPLQRESFISALKQFSSRLPNTYTNKPHTMSNVEHLHRNSIDKLSLTEEELTRSELVEGLKETPEVLVELMQTMVTEFDELVDNLIHSFVEEDLELMHDTMHTINGMAKNLNLTTLANQAQEIEILTVNKQLPKIEQLQKLLNRVQVNLHQGQRLISQYRTIKLDAAK